MKNKTLFLLRVAMGWVFLYAGLTKVINPNWSAAGYLGSAKTFPEFYKWLSGQDILPYINFLNEWGLTLLGASLILGALVRYSSLCGALLMLLYYLVALDFPKIGTTSYLVDQHVIYILVLSYFVFARAGEYWGVDGWWKSRK